MNTPVAAPSADTTLLDLVSFKWLMAGRGWWVNLSRLQQDADYLRGCALCGLDSGDALLQQRSAKLLAVLGHPEGEHSPRPAFALSNDVRL